MSRAKTTSKAKSAGRAATTAGSVVATASAKKHGNDAQLVVKNAGQKAKLNDNAALRTAGAKSGKKSSNKSAVEVAPQAREKFLSMGSKKKGGEVELDPDYRPSDDEPFMNERQRAYFRVKLKTWKEDIIRQTRETLAGLHEDSTQHADLADRATSETDRALELRARDRQRKLINKIDAALARIEDGSYGYCEETGEPIGLKRLDARPIATLSVEAQERHERRERVYRED